MKALTVALLVGAMMALTAATGASKNETMSSSEGHDSKARSPCPRGWIHYYDRCFLYISRILTWAQAERNCLYMGGNLASIRSPDEYREIQGMIVTQDGNSPDTWIGGSDAQEEDTWFWSDGTLFTFQHWCSGKPCNAAGQHCLRLHYGAEKCWDDFSCSTRHYSVCAKKLL